MRHAGLCEFDANLVYIATNVMQTLPQTKNNKRDIYRVEVIDLYKSCSCT